MSAGFYRSPKAACPVCAEPLHPGMVGDIRAHAEASGEPVRFSCSSCGAALSWRPKVRRLPVKKTVSA